MRKQAMRAKTIRKMLAGVILFLAATGGLWAADARWPGNWRDGNWWDSRWWGGPVGGVAIDAHGVLQTATRDALAELRQMRAQALAPVPAEMDQSVPLRKVSLRRLQDTLRRCRQAGQPVPDALKVLAGLQRIKYVIAYPERQDIVLVGPAEGWKLDEQGNLVGVRSGRPPLLLDDLIVALRAARAAEFVEITCSIDPTAEGLRRLQQQVENLRTMGEPARTARRLEETLGHQRISISGVPADSHFARVLVAADYRMKRLAMNFDRSPIRGMTSFLQMVESKGVGIHQMMPRWWLVPNYQPPLRDEEGLTWGFRGASVKAMTESDLLTASGQRQHTGQADPAAQRWADMFTNRYAELAAADPIFGELQNCMDLTLVASLLVSEKLAEKTGCNLDLLLDAAAVPVVQLSVPRQVPSQASFVKKDNNWVISVSGGVRIRPRAMLANPEKSNSLGKVRNEADLAVHEDWWWN